ncbi:MAG: adenylate kinase, partial [Acidobacteria bacterium]|nr:adenylate kinase [Acidobacteriota bacterium]MBV9480512.1 adenylate kinase [Acidobacteriota bacterium]
MKVLAPAAVASEAAGIGPSQCLLDKVSRHGVGRCGVKLNVDQSRRKFAVVLLGPPGAGKGTQAKVIAAHCRVPHISSGDLLRDHVARGTKLGIQAKSVMARGELVPDDLVYDMVVWRLRQRDAEQGFILDGFPRTAAQAGWLDAFLEHEFFDNAHASKGLPVVVEIQVDYNNLLRRLTGRRTCPAGHIYNIYLQPPRVDEVCDVDGLTLVIRNDDREQVIRERLAAYERETKPLADYYWATERLFMVNGDLPVPEVTAQIAKVIEAHCAVAMNSKL